jgi:hypothetical protein
VNLLRAVKESGATPEEQIPVDISYEIVRHVSAQLYTSPRKAIEELVCNSYDAGASQCHLVLPQTAKEALRVLDNGKSMDLEGLRGLWRVAQSPKGSDPNRIANNRMQIGKFGVGKLAAFALGERLTHVACVKDEVRVISVGQHEIKDKSTKAGRRAPEFQVYRLTPAKARSVLAPMFANLPNPSSVLSCFLSFPS